MIFNIGVCGTCRIDFKIKKKFPYNFKIKDFNFYIRPVGYTVSISEIYQNLSLVKNNLVDSISNNFIKKNIFFKENNKDIIKVNKFDILIIEICSIKKIIHKNTNLIIPYRIWGSNYHQNDFYLDLETEEEIIKIIKKIQEEFDCKIILIPPITVIKFITDEILIKKISENRNHILNILMKCENQINNVYLFNWNKIINENNILIDQYHFSNEGYKIIFNNLLEFIKKIL